jgi:hypothetical protein
MLDWKRPSLTKELAVTLVVKTLFLAAIWFFVFYQPDRPPVRAADVSCGVLGVGARAQPAGNRTRRSHRGC